MNVTTAGLNSSNGALVDLHTFGDLLLRQTPTHPQFPQLLEQSEVSGHLRTRQNVQGVRVVEPQNVVNAHRCHLHFSDGI